MRYNHKPNGVHVLILDCRECKSQIKFTVTNADDAIKKIDTAGWTDSPVPYEDLCPECSK